MLDMNQLIEMKMNKRRDNYYESLGYDFTKCTETIKVKLLHLRKSSRQYVKFKCDYCGQIFERKYADYNRNIHSTKLETHACKKCKGEKLKQSNLLSYGVTCTSNIREVRDSQLKTRKENGTSWTYSKIKKIIECAGYKLITDEMEINVNTKLRVQCEKKHIYITDAHHFVNHGSRCGICNTSVLKSNAQFIEELTAKFKGEYVPLEPYRGTLHKLQFKHKVCLKIFKMTPSYLLTQEGTCPHCSSRIKSKGLLKILEVLDYHNISYDLEKRFKGCRYKKTLPFDIQIEDILIEYDGEQHFRPVKFGGRNDTNAEERFELNKKRDLIKNKFCIDNNIKMVRIPFTEKDNLPKIVKDIIHKNLNNDSIKNYIVTSKWNHDNYLRSVNGI